MFFNFLVDSGKVFIGCFRLLGWRFEVILCHVVKFLNGTNVFRKVLKGLLFFNFYLEFLEDN